MSNYCDDLRKLIDKAPEPMKSQLQTVYDVNCGGVHTNESGGGPTSPPPPPPPPKLGGDTDG